MAWLLFITLLATAAILLIILVAMEDHYKHPLFILPLVVPAALLIYLAGWVWFAAPIWGER